jgi:hypothetical protein
MVSADRARARIDETLLSTKYAVLYAIKSTCYLVLGPPGLGPYP